LPVLLEFSLARLPDHDSHTSSIAKDIRLV